MKTNKMLFKVIPHQFIGTDSEIGEILAKVDYRSPEVFVKCKDGTLFHVGCLAGWTRTIEQ